MDRRSRDLYLSVITIAEIEEGTATARMTGADRLADWLDTVLHLYGVRVVPLGLPTAQVLGRLADRVRGLGQAPGLADLAIAATAETLGYTVLTRTLRHFRAFGVAAHDPFDTLPEFPTRS